MRVLVLTNHFSEFAGSEMVALEVAQWFEARGDEVVLAANLIGPPISDLAGSITLTAAIEEIEVGSFDLVGCHHNLLSLLPYSALLAAASAPPLIAMASLSPFEPYEHLDGRLAAAVGAVVFANSAESAAEIARRNPSFIRRNRIIVFHNAAPAAFWGLAPSRPRALGSLTIISNHVPPELEAAISIFEARGIRVRRIGLNHDYRRVAPGDLDDCDALVTIGKSVVYAMARAKPVYIYDAFGGSGWLTTGNFDTNLAHNFSGRPGGRRLTAEALADDVFNGFDRAADEMQRLHQAHDWNMFQLGHYLDPLRQRAETAKRLRSLKWRSALASPRVRAHLEFARRNQHVMRRSYLLANRGTLSHYDHHADLWSSRAKPTHD